MQVPASADCDARSHPTPFIPQTNAKPHPGPNDRLHLVHWCVLCCVCLSLCLPITACRYTPLHFTKRNEHAGGRDHWQTLLLIYMHLAWPDSKHMNQDNLPLPSFVSLFFFISSHDQEADISLNHTDIAIQVLLQLLLKLVLKLLELSSLLCHFLCLFLFIHQVFPLITLCCNKLPFSPKSFLQYFPPSVPAHLPPPPHGRANW